MGQQREGNLQAGGQQGGLQTVGTSQEQTWHELRDHGQSSQVRLTNLYNEMRILSWHCSGITTREEYWPRWTDRDWCTSSLTYLRLVILSRWSVAGSDHQPHRSQKVWEMKLKLVYESKSKPWLHIDPWKPRLYIDSSKLT